MSGDPVGVSLNGTVGVTNPGHAGANTPQGVARMTTSTCWGSGDELTDEGSGSVDAAVGMAIDPYRKSQINS